MGITDISPETSLKPKARYAPELGDNIINIDGAISLMLVTDTPEAKAMLSAYRKRLAELRQEQPDLKGEKLREAAFIEGLEAAGVRFTDKGRISGTMEDSGVANDR